MIGTFDLGKIWCRCGGKHPHPKEKYLFIKQRVTAAGTEGWPRNKVVGERSAKLWELLHGDVK